MNNKRGKIIVIAAPSGCGKSTIINALLEGGDLNLGFAVSATTRPPRLEFRGTETPAVIAVRVDRAQYEISRASEFDTSVVNDRLDEAIVTVRNIIKGFTALY